MLSFFKVDKNRLFAILTLFYIVAATSLIVLICTVDSRAVHILAVIVIALLSMTLFFRILNNFFKKMVQRNKMMLELFDTMDEIVFIQDLKGNIEYINHDNDNDIVLSNLVMRDCDETDENTHISQSFTDLEAGKTSYFDFARMPFKGLDNVTRLLVVVKDLTKMHDLELTAGKNKQRLEQVLSVSGEGLWEWNIKTGQVLHNDQWVKITGIGRSENSFKEFESCIFDEDKDKVFIALDGLIKNNTSYDVKYRFKRPDGKIIWVWDRGRIAELDQDGKPLWIVGLVLDITQEQANQQRISSLAYFDQLTGLTNRTQCEVELSNIIDKNMDTYSAVLLLDLDRFKLMNDGYGHHMGDKLLYEVAKRIEGITVLPSINTRFGGDEFVILIPDIHADKEMAQKLAHQHADKVMESISQVYVLQAEIESVKIEYSITASIGGVLFSTDDTDKDTLLKVADVALARTKARGGHAVTILDDEEKKHLADKTALYQSLIEAEVDKEFFIHLQPKYDLQQTIIGAEALVRWEHPTRGFLTPWAFIDMAEENNMILAIGETVLHQGCQVLKDWQSTPETENLLLSVNVSAKQIWQSTFAEECIEIVKSYNIDPSKLTIEITESILIQDLDDAIVKLNKLRTFGIQISLDDFGTGFSSLSYLRQLPIDELKIDQSFVRNLTEDTSSQLLVKSIIDLAENFNLLIVAEGVETLAHFDMLKGLGVPLHQGYYFSKPVSRKDFDLLLKKEIKLNA